MVTKHLRIHGRVQGVFYRESMCREAARLNVGGWVRNRGDGSVEAVVHGRAEAVDAMLAWAGRGPERARVERVEVSEGMGSYSSFERLPDA
jgi:acylphosphatase